MVGQDLSIELHTSNKLIAENVGNAYKLYKSYVNTIGLMPPNAVEEYEVNDIQPMAGDDGISSIKPENDSSLASVAAAGVGLFDNEEAPADNIEKDIYSDLFETESADGDSNNDNSLIDDMSMFLEEDENGNV